MIPADMSFHDATIAAIERDGTDTILHIEDVAMNDGEDVVNGTLTLDGVRRILRDGKEIPELAMAGDDGEIVELDELPGPGDPHVRHLDDLRVAGRGAGPLSHRMQGHAVGGVGIALLAAIRPAGTRQIFAIRLSIRCM